VVKALKAGISTGVQQGRFHVAPSALRDLAAGYLGRCPRLLHCAPLVLNKYARQVFDESSMSFALPKGGAIHMFGATIVWS